MILCPELSAPANGGVTLNTQTFGVGTTATYSCDPGYVLVGEITRTCEDTHRGTTGTWNGTEPLCDGMQTLIMLNNNTISANKNMLQRSSDASH